MTKKREPYQTFSKEFKQERFMNHPILGQLEEKDDYFIGSMHSDGKAVVLIIDLDGASTEQAFEFAEKVVDSISSLMDKAKNVISRDLLEIYNSGWNEYDEVQEDGSTKTVINPKLDTADFVCQFELDRVSVSGGTCVEFRYKPNDLFWGHRVFVTSFDGLGFEDALAKLFG